MNPTEPPGTKTSRLAQTVLVVLAVILIGLVVTFALTALDNGTIQAPGPLRSPHLLRRQA